MAAEFRSSLLVSPMVFLMLADIRAKERRRGLDEVSSGVVVGLARLSVVVGSVRWEGLG